MNDQEKQIISDIFKRLEGTAGQARDPDAERFIADKVKGQPYAPYAMAQALYVQEEAMKSLNGQLEQLKAENDQLRQQGQNKGFLSSIFGGGQSAAPQPGAFQRGQGGYAPQGGGYAPQGGYPQQGGPWGGQPQGGPWGGQQPQAQGGGFLRGALTTAAGVAGGMVVGNALMNAFSGGSHSTLGNLSQGDMASLGFPDGGAAAGAGGFQDASFSDGGGVFGGGGGGSQYQDASFSDGGGLFGGGGGGSDYQDASFSDGGSDFGGGGDDGWT